MSWKIWLPVFLFVFSLKIDFNTGAEFDNCKEFIQVNVSDYDTNTSSVNDLSKRPLGFLSAAIPFKAINPNAKNPCFQITLDDSTKQTVQVLAAATIGTSTVCVLSDLPNAQQTCDAALKTCRQNAIGHDTIKYVFSCDTCDADITIWFRLTISPSFTDGLDFEYWCDNFNANYPDSLIVLARSPVDPDPSPTSNASTASLVFMWIVCLNFAFLVISLY